jgi:periplasmic protein TonB
MTYLIFKNQNSIEITMDEIVFEKRNKNYGAYLLRRTYGNHMIKAILSASLLFILMIISPSLVSFKTIALKEDVTPVILDNYDRNVPLFHTEIVPKTHETKSPKTISSIVFVPPKIVNESVMESTENSFIPPSNTEITIGNKTEIGESNQSFNPTKGIDNGKEIALEESIPQKERIFNFVEQMPTFPEGEAALFKFVRDNIIYPTTAKENNIEGKVFLSFVINKDGTVEDINIKRGIGGGCNEEAIRVISMMPKWIPGKQNGKPVRVVYNMPISYTLQ